MSAYDTQLTELEKLDRATINRLHGKKTNVIHGRSISLAYGLILLGGLAMIGSSIWLLFFSADFYAVGTAGAEAVAATLEWGILLYTPITFGSIIIIISAVSISFSLLSVKQAEGFEDLMRKTMGKRLDSGIKPKYGDCDKCIVLVSRFLVLSFILLQIILAITVFGVMLYFDNSIDEIGDEELSNKSLTSRAFDFQFALFNECCFEQGFSQQGEVLKCPNFACTLPPEFALFVDDTLCKCFSSSPETYNSYLNIIAQENLCATLARSQVSLAEEEFIPGTAISLDLVFSKDIVPLVGSFEEDGCGVGFAAGFQWVYYLWILSYIRAYVYTFLGISIAQTMLVAFIFYRNYTGLEEAKLAEQMKRLENRSDGKSRLESLFDSITPSFLKQKSPAQHYAEPIHMPPI